MIFSSLPFLFFFSVYALAWAISNTTFRLLLLIVGSLFFYGYWNWHYALLPLLLSLVAFFTALLIEKFHNTYLYFLGIILLLLPLAYYKYFNFLFDSTYVTEALPLGISFITFTLVSYVIDVKRKTFAVEQKFNVFLAYIVFFPQLIAGPILRPHELIPQIKNLPSTNKTLIATGILIFSIGLGKKLLFADQIAPYVDHVYADPYAATWTQWFIAFYGFPMQVYNDFSGYTDMAIGLALFFGFTLPINFDRPFGAHNTAELWRRWHMTLTNWFRDYVYFPLVKVSKLNRILTHFLAAWLVMTLVGFWHGAGLTFLLWGSINGLTVAIINTMKLKKIAIKLPLLLKIILTFHWFAITVILFRAENMTNAVDMYTVLFSKALMLQPFSVTEIYPILLLAIFFLLHRFDSIAYLKETFIHSNKIILISFIFFIWIASFVFGFDHSSSKFIYFDF